MLTKADFRVDSGSGVWFPRHQQPDFGYSDGTESALLKKIEACKDRSVFSEEFFPFADWSEEYHLCRDRGNLFRIFDEELKPGTRIFELGAGCGAITRFLGEKGCHVTAVEGAPARARIAKARCADLPGVQVFCANFQDLDFSADSFDLVTLIGVFEYSALFFEGSSPFEKSLALARRHMSEKSLLVLAIENQLGLKYFNGMKEDHLGKRFFGINGLYQMGKKTAQTFTRRTLSEMVHAAGLKNQRFYYPFPDYKIPKLLLTEEAFRCDPLKPNQLINGFKSRDYGSESAPLFHEASVFEGLQEEGIASSFAHSFLLVASQGQVARPDWMARLYATGRKAAFSTETMIREDQNGKMVVEKGLLAARTPVPESGKFTVVHSLRQKAPFLEGFLMSYEMERTLLLEGSRAWPLLKDLLVNYLDFLVFRSQDGALPGGWFDAIPSNIVKTSAGLVYFDDEWTIHRSLPIQLVFMRGMVALFGTVESSWVKQVPHRSLEETMKEIFESKQIAWNEQIRADVLGLDSEIHEVIFPRASASSYRDELASVLDRDLNRVRLKNRYPILGKIKRRLLRFKA